MQTSAFAQAVVPGPDLTPAEQQAKFHLPPGFKIQLVLSDPDIGQPMNLAFDARGRLWVTHSIEYPYPATSEGVEPRTRFKGQGEHPPRDRLTVVTGIDENGKATGITHFATGLNIPIGHTPLGDGSEALVYGIPSIFRVTDTNGDGQAEETHTLYSRFGNIDVHGNSNGYRRWIDGWIYGCHGFANHSEITDGEGRTTILDSGNTYRFREDGSRFEQFTWGQVNPFGLTFDPWGNLYSSDCHSMPIYMLLRGARYPHFGSKPDALGFGPTMIDHGHGSTGICGPAYYAADHFPADFRDNIFICNPVTSRIHRDRLVQRGSTYQCETQDDFVTCDDLLFRPVDLTVGPDGALYIADFYNAVIGHYEAPLDHPRRNRQLGRVWRVVWKGEDGAVEAPRLPDLATLPVEELAQQLGNANLQSRTLATNLLVDHFPETAPDAVRSLMEAAEQSEVRAHGMWVLERLASLSPADITRLARDSSPLVRTHVMKLLAERSELSAPCRQLLHEAMSDPNAFVVRSAADALGRHPQAENIRPLLECWQTTPEFDTHLIHTCRLSLRIHLRNSAIVTKVLAESWSVDLQPKLIEIAASTEDANSIPILLTMVDPTSTPAETLNRAAEQIARSGSAEQLQTFISLAPDWFPDDADRQLQLLSSICLGLEQNGVALATQSALKHWYTRLAPRRLEAVIGHPGDWTELPIDGQSKSSSPFGVRSRRSTDDRMAPFWDSISGGEQLTGVLRSPRFALPETFSFWLCGHNGRPGTNPDPVNHVRLVLAETGEEIARQLPLRNDTARLYSWTLPEHVGQPVYFEIVDGFAAPAFAWLAAGRFDPPLINVPPPGFHEEALRLIELSGALRVTSVSGQILEIASAKQQALDVRSAALNAAVSILEPADSLALLQKLTSDASEPAELRSIAAAELGAIDLPTARQSLVAALTVAPARLQGEFAASLCQNPAGIRALLEVIAAGKASAQLLRTPAIADIISSSGSAVERERVAELTMNLVPADEQMAEVINRQRAEYQTATVSLQHGQELFRKHCGNCHRIGPSGPIVGPQLDGVGKRGLDRLLEDVLDPNRNVDAAFRTSVIVTTEGKLYTGLERRREGRIVIISDSQGKEIRIPEDNIDDSRKTALSLMPANFAQTLKAEELNDLIAYLLSLK
ncbi:DUF7133 domain-containing protein [Rubinisphaera margarita]|uniref:DUF7133 domain-containing protein n=1 Tax=Rubinisphaera margarita TaxID=2909586 RepID=UPI001EE78FD8|nr:HEAT repeat domain-containing protein [Rubinisphaera margarita]MCG6158258.1 HEAT repeat domain-containing protein [Rubinisphaera margarita]